MLLTGWTTLALVLCVLQHVSGQFAEEDRGLHKKRRRQQQQNPCGYGREAEAVGEDGRSLKLVAALGGAAVGYKLGQQNHQQPIINNNIYNGGGAPCGGGGGASWGSTGPYAGGLLGSHPLLAQAVGLGVPRGGVNWDRTVRQFERNVVRPLTRWW